MNFKLTSIIHNLFSSPSEREFKLSKNIKAALLAATIIGAPFVATNAEAVSKSCGACVYPAPAGHSGGVIPQGTSCFGCHNPPVTPPPVVTPPPPVVTPPPPVVTPKPPVVTPKPPVVTPKPPVVTPKPPVVTPKPPVVTPKPAKHDDGHHEKVKKTSHNNGQHDD